MHCKWVDVLRDGKVVSVRVPTFTADGVGVDRMVVWAGALLHTKYERRAASS